MKNYIKSLLNKKNDLTDPDALKDIDNQIKTLSSFDKEFDDLKAENKGLKENNETLKTDLIDALKNSAVGTSEAPIKEVEEPVVKTDAEVYKDWKAANNETNA